jgi:hypothetical protein
MEIEDLDVAVVRSHVVHLLESWLEAMPEEMRRQPFAAPATPEAEGLTPEQMVNNVRDSTPLGKEIMEAAFALTLVDSLTGDV